MVKRELEKEAEKFLIDYGVAVLMLNKKHPEGEDTSARMRGLEKLHEDGVKRIKALVTEFNK